MGGIGSQSFPPKCAINGRGKTSSAAALAPAFNNSRRVKLVTIVPLLRRSLRTSGSARRGQRPSWCGWLATHDSPADGAITTTGDRIAQYPYRSKTGLQPQPLKFGRDILSGMIEYRTGCWLVP